MAITTRVDEEQGIYEFLGDDGKTYQFYDKDISGLRSVSECDNEQGIDIPQDVTSLVDILESLAGDLNMVLTAIDGEILEEYIDEASNCNVAMASNHQSPSGGRQA